MRLNETGRVCQGGGIECALLMVFTFSSIRKAVPPFSWRTGPTEKADWQRYRSRPPSSGLPKFAQSFSSSYPALDNTDTSGTAPGLAVSNLSSSMACSIYRGPSAVVKQTKRNIKVHMSHRRGPGEAGEGEEKGTCDPQQPHFYSSTWKSRSLVIAIWVE